MKFKSLVFNNLIEWNGTIGDNNSLVSFVNGSYLYISKTGKYNLTIYGKNVCNSTGVNITSLDFMYSPSDEIIALKEESDMAIQDITILTLIGLFGIYLVWRRNRIMADLLLLGAGIAITSRLSSNDAWIGILLIVGALINSVYDGLRAMKGKNIG